MKHRSLSWFVSEPTLISSSCQSVVLYLVLDSQTWAVPGFRPCPVCLQDAKITICFSRKILATIIHAFAANILFAFRMCSFCFMSRSI